MGLILQGIRDFSLGNEEEALAAFSHALAGTDDATSAALCSARLLILRRRNDEAVELLEALVDSKPGLADARLLLGTAQKNKGRIFEAMRSFRAALLLDPGNESAESALSEILEAQEP
jgi:Flp pilus assembly protein TadD